jgi:hypothetical protein
MTAKKEGNMPAKFLTRDALLELAGKPLPTETVHLPAPLDVDVFVRGMSGTERDAWMASQMVSPGKSDETDLRNASAKLFAATVVDEQGNHLFTLEDAEAIGRIPGDLLAPVVEVAGRLSGLQSRAQIGAALGNAPSGSGGSS